MRLKDTDLIVVGGGPAGSVLARIVSKLGHRVILLESDKHPREAIGESSTPLAALSLERLASRYSLPDLHALATWSRLRDYFPESRLGLKRGFTFFKHQAGEAFRCSEANESRLLVAASPHDGVADSHWWRAQVDHDLFQRAAEAGVESFQEVRVESVEFTEECVKARFRRDGQNYEVQGALLVDASGAGAFLPRQLGLRRAPMQTHSGFVGGHFRGVPPFAEVAPESSLSDDPYPADCAAVHHILEEGWLYALRFDDGLVSAGLLVDGGLGVKDEEEAWSLFHRVTDRYPSLQASFADAQRRDRTWWSPRLGRCWSRAAGPRWVLMPHTFAFADPLYSSGLAWTFLGVERLASILEERGGSDPAIADGSAFDFYSRLLAREAAHTDRLMATAYQTFPRFETFTQQAMIYFAAASFMEARGRLCPKAKECWEGFLGATDPLIVDLLAEVHRRSRQGDPLGEEEFAHRLRSRNLAGLAMADKKNLYGVEARDLVQGAHLLGLKTQVVEAALPRLMGQPATEFE